MSTYEGDAQRVWRVQCALVATAALAWWLRDSAGAAGAALFGGMVAMLHSWMLRRRVRLAQRVARVTPGGEAAVLYLGAVQRFVTVLALFAMALGWLGLRPLPLLVAFGLAQCGYVVVGGLTRTQAGRRVENL